MTHFIRSIFAVLAAAFVAQGAAAGEAQSTVSGTVSAVYARLANGVFVAVNVPHAGAGRMELWADVRLDAPLANGRDFAIALVEAGILLEPGDTVELKLAAAEPQPVQRQARVTPFAGQSRVVAVGSRTARLAELLFRPRELSF